MSADVGVASQDWDVRWEMLTEPEDAGPTVSIHQWNWQRLTEISLTQADWGWKYFCWETNLLFVPGLELGWSWDIIRDESWRHLGHRKWCEENNTILGHKNGRFSIQSTLLHPSASVEKLHCTWSHPFIDNIVVISAMFLTTTLNYCVREQVQQLWFIFSN